MMQTAVRDNYYALCICVLTEKIPEEAFVDIGILSKQKTKSRKHAAVNNLSDEAPEDVKEILRLRKNHTWKQIGESLGISDRAAYQRVYRYSKRKKR